MPRTKIRKPHFISPCNVIFKYLLNSKNKEEKWKRRTKKRILSNLRMSKESAKNFSSMGQIDLWLGVSISAYWIQK
jgi:hypothetical protein